jgi:cytochrome c
MSDLTANKYLGAGLGAALLLVGLSVGVPIIFKQDPPAKPGDLIAVAPDASAPGAPPADLPPDWGTVLAKADVSAGEAKTAICKACHIFDPSGANLIGPGLYGVLGRKPGSHPGFAYSAAMTAFGAKQPIWDYEHVYEFINAPQTYIPGTKMTYTGLKDSQDRINVIAYLHTLGSGLPIPKPAPAAAQAAPAPAAAAPAKPA